MMLDVSVVLGGHPSNIGGGYWSFPPEMEKRADTADISVLFFSLVVLIFWLYTRKLAKIAVLLALC